MHTSNILKFKKIYTYKYDVFGFVFNMYSAPLIFLFVRIHSNVYCQYHICNFDK